MIAYFWDEVGCEVTSLEMADPPAGLTDEDVLILADGRISISCGSEPTSNHKFRNEDGVLVLDAKFGQDKVTRTYVCLGDDAKAKSLAELELDALED
jgi:hypothetical protein